MEGLRGFSVVLVFLVHYVTLVNPWMDPASSLLDFSNALHTMGNAGVDMFFVLSGYLIYGSLLSRSQTFGRFMLRRVERIYPVFMTVFVVYIALSFVFPSENKIPASFSQGLIYLLQNFFLLPGFFPIQPLITVAWSLSYEMFCYLEIHSLIPFLGLRQRSARWRVYFFLTMAVVMLAYCGVYGGPVRLTMFIAGILLYEAIQSRSLPTPPGGVALAALLFGLLAPLAPWGGQMVFAFKTSVLFVAFFVVCLACFRDPAAWLSRAYSWRPLRWLGNMSYSYYLVHGLALKAGFLLLAFLLPMARYGDWLFWALLPTMFALTLLAAAVLFLAVERPFSLEPVWHRARSAKSLSRSTAS